MAFHVGDEDGPLSDINVTPLVDVMLVLLILFMITAPMLHRGIAVRLPESKTDSLRQTADSPVILSLRSDRTIWIDETPVARGVLEERLGAKLAGRRERNVFLKADRGLPYGFIVDVLDALNRAGIDGVGMITTPAEAGGQAKR